MRQLDALARASAHARGDALPAPFGRIFPDLAPGPPSDRRDAPEAPGAPAIVRPDDGFARLVAHDLGIVTDPAPGVLPSPTAGPPRLVLDGLYGNGPLAAPHLYDPADRARLLAAPAADGARRELAALHDIVVDEVRAEGLLFWPVVFSEARRRVVHRYQRTVLDELLPRWVGRPLVDAVRRHGRRAYRPVEAAFVPLELLALAPWLVPERSPTRPCPATWTLPPGAAIARALGIAPLAPTNVAPDTPLDAYVAAESRIIGAGQRLGPVGGHLLAEVVLGVLELDVDSCLGMFGSYSRTVRAVATA